MKLRQIIDAAPALQKLATAELPIKRLYWVRKTLNKLNGEIEFFNEERIKILAKHNTSKDKDFVKIPPDKIDEVNEQINELLDTDVEVDNLKKFAINASDDIKLSVADINALEVFVDFDFEEFEERDEPC